MWFTDTKESVPTMDNPHTAIILSKPLPSISKPQRRRIDFSKWRDPSKQKYFSGPNLLENLHWSSFNNLYTGWSLSSTKIWPELNSCVVFSTISKKWYCVSSVCTDASIKGRIAEMSGFLVWWFLWECYQAHAVQTLVVLAVLSDATSCDTVSIIAAWGGWKWCRGQCRRHGTCLQWSKKVFNICVRRWVCINFQRWSVLWVF